MNVVLPEKEKMHKRIIAIYIIAILVCFIAIAVVVGFEVLGEDIVNNIFGINKLFNKSEAEEATLKANFESLLQNNITNMTEVEIKKIDSKKDIIETSYSKQEETENYNINVNIPYINIKSDLIKEFNNKIENNIKKKAEQTLKNKKSKIVYNVKYQASIENDILSLIIYSDLKDGKQPQRVSIETLNYDIKNDRNIDLEDLIGIYSLNKSSVQSKINEEIKKEIKKSEALKDAGYNIFDREKDNQMYKIKNTNNFFINDEVIYIIYAYGNDTATTEMDIVIL